MGEPIGFFTKTDKRVAADKYFLSDYSMAEPMDSSLALSRRNVALSGSAGNKTLGFTVERCVTNSPVIVGTY